MGVLNGNLTVRKFRKICDHFYRSTERSGYPKKGKMYTHRKPVTSFQQNSNKNYNKGFKIEKLG